MSSDGSSLRLLDRRPTAHSFLLDLQQGLQKPQKEVPCKYFYDEAGSNIFERICRLDEYYLYRTELAIMQKHGSEIALQLGKACLLLELGSGSSIKTCTLLDSLENPAGYVPLDISKESLMASAQRLQSLYPSLKIFPICADIKDDFDLPVLKREAKRRVVYFPGSTIGNFHPPDVVSLLRRLAKICGPGGSLLIGVDLKKNPVMIEKAYNDASGVTALFNKNVLVRANRELAADFQIENFAHRAFYDPKLGRVEMHLVSTQRQIVSIGDVSISFVKGETIRTECSYKYSRTGFAALADQAGLSTTRVWTDPKQLFSVQVLNGPATS